MAHKRRVDLSLIHQGLVDSRQEAQKLIRAGKVRDLSGRLLDKPGQEIPVDLELKVKERPRFVSRGGEKLLAALNTFPIRLQGRVCLDGGISTGGFTDCLLQHGAARVYGIDVGYGQTAWNLRNDPRVVLRERTNLRKLRPEEIYGSDDPWPNFVVADVSFISLRLVLPAINSLLDPQLREGVLLVKPQFEVGPERVGKGGVVKDVAAHVEVLELVINAAEDEGMKPRGLIPSPLTGPAGNHEYLLWIGEKRNPDLPDLKKLVVETLL